MIGSRKFAIAGAALLSLTGLCAFGSIGAVEYVAGLVATVGAYITGNVAQKAITKDG